jgi:hypothetical protein
MLITSAIAAAILAHSTIAAPAPRAAPAPPTLTQQLFVADTAAARFDLLPEDTDFVFDFNNSTLKGVGGLGGDLAVANRHFFPALVGTGSGMAVGFLGPGGFNTPHVHPRATELQIVISGTVKTEMVPENGVLDGKHGRRVISNTLSAFMMQPFYQGSIHTQFNPSCSENATFVASFNSEDFGVGQVPDELFAMSDDVLSAAFGQAIDAADLDKFRAAIPVSIAKGVEACLATCDKNSPYGSSYSSSSSSVYASSSTSVYTPPSSSAYYSASTSTYAPASTSTYASSSSIYTPPSSSAYYSASTSTYAPASTSAYANKYGKTYSGY